MHHIHTLIVGKDSEIAAPAAECAGAGYRSLLLKDGPTQFRRLFHYASGDLTEDGKNFVPKSERGKVIFAARV
jgi:hypothetical protein